jgi:hypothetical protein
MQRVAAGKGAFSCKLLFKGSGRNATATLLRPQVKRWSMAHENMDCGLCGQNFR